MLSRKVEVIKMKKGTDYSVPTGISFFGIKL